MGKIYMHIGTGKTGSSAIQAFLTLNNEELGKQGFCFPNPPDIENDQPFQTTAGNGVFIYRMLQMGKLNELENILQKHIENDDDIILSAEVLIPTFETYFDEMVELVKKFDIKIIMYVRRQDDYLISSYNQLVKNHGLISDFEIEETIHHHYEVVEKLVNLYDKDTLIIRPYEKSQFIGGNIYADFLNCLHINLTSNFILPNKIVNPSLSLDTLEFRKSLNKVQKLQDNKSDKLTYLLNKYLLDYVVYEQGKGEAFTSLNLLSKAERLKILEIYDELNEKIAKKFLDREDGVLFYDELPDLDISQENNGSIEDYLSIAENVLKNKYNENSTELMNELSDTLKDIVANFVFNKIVEGTEFEEDKSKLYKLNKEAIALNEFNESDDHVAYRDIALSFEHYNNIEQAYKYMYKANQINPRVPLTKVKLEYYRRLLESEL